MLGVENLFFTLVPRAVTGPLSTTDFSHCSSYNHKNNEREAMYFGSDSSALMCLLLQMWALWLTAGCYQPSFVPLPLPARAEVLLLSPALTCVLGLYSHGSCADLALQKTLIMLK